MDRQLQKHLAYRGCGARKAQAPGPLARPTPFIDHMQPFTNWLFVLGAKSLLYSHSQGHYYRAKRIEPMTREIAPYQKHSVTHPSA